MKRASLLTTCLILCLLAAAQSHHFRFFSVPGLPVAYQGFAGKIGSHFFMLNRFNPEGLDLFVYDTVSQTGNKRVYPFPRQLSALITKEKSLVFIALTRHAKGIDYHYLELDENGDTVRQKINAVNANSTGLSAVTSPNQQHILFFQHYRVSPDSAVVQGTMIGSNGAVEKTLAYTYKHDKERDEEPGTFVDNSGATHILVYDKYNNYRISTDLGINTIPFDEEEMTSEAFSLQKTKLKSANFFQNPSCDCIQMQGVYVDGPLKRVRGIYTISFPAKRKNEIRRRFSLFTPEMLKSFRKGFSTSDAAIANALMLQNIITTDSGTYAIFRLTAELVTIAEGRSNSGGPRPMMNSSNNVSPVSMRANGWNAPKIVYVKLTKAQDIEWHAIQSLDVFRFSDTKYNRVFFGAGNPEVVTMLYQAEKEEPRPVLVTLKDGVQTTEKFPEKFMTFTPIHSFSPQLFGSIYVNPKTNDGGIVLIQTVKP